MTRTTQRSPATGALDALDLRLLHALQLDGRAPFSRIAAVLGVSDQTVARRFRRLRGTAGVRVVGMTDQNLLGRANWILRLRCTPDTAEQLATALARRDDTMFVDIVSGGTEVMCSMKPHGQEERGELLLHQLRRTPRIVSVTAHCLLHMYYRGPLGRVAESRALNPDQEAALRPPHPGPVGAPVSVDDTDEALLALLRRDGRATFAELQAATGHTEAVVKRRVERLRGTGVLYFDVRHDSTSLGRGVSAMLWLTVAPSEMDAAGHALASHPEVEFAAATTGEANLVASVATRSTGELHTYLSERVGALDGIRASETVLTLRQVKQPTYEPVVRGRRRGTA